MIKVKSLNKITVTYLQAMESARITLHMANKGTASKCNIKKKYSFSYAHYNNNFKNQYFAILTIYFLLYIAW